MKRKGCAQEAEIVEASRVDRLSDRQGEHLASCESCSEAVTVASWMRQQAKDPGLALAVPDAESIWWRSRVVRQLCDSEDLPVEPNPPAPRSVSTSSSTSLNSTRVTGAITN